MNNTTRSSRKKRQLAFGGGFGLGFGAYDYNDYYGDYVSDYAYDYYDWVCSEQICQLCDILTSECCDPDRDVNCFLPDSCLNNPCLSGGTCITTRTIDNRPDFICVCLPGLTGKYCQMVNDYFVGAEFLLPPVLPIPPPVGPGPAAPVAAAPVQTDQPSQPVQPAQTTSSPQSAPVYFQPQQYNQAQGAQQTPSQIQQPYYQYQSQMQQYRQPQAQQYRQPQAQQYAQPQAQQYVQPQAQQYVQSQYAPQQNYQQYPQNYYSQSNGLNNNQAFNQE